MRTAGTIVAINKDGGVPIGEFADLLVVGDLFTNRPRAHQARPRSQSSPCLAARRQRRSCAPTRKHCMNNRSRSIAGAFFAATLVTLVTFGATAAPKGVRPLRAPRRRGTPAPLPTATPEPPNIAIPRLEAKLKADPNDRDRPRSSRATTMRSGGRISSLPLTQRLLRQALRTPRSTISTASRTARSDGSRKRPTISSKPRTSNRPTRRCS